MIRKTDRIFKRTTRVWERAHLSEELVVEDVRRETWWLFGILPLYSRCTVLYRPR